LADTCLKCIVLVTNFQKSPSAGGSPSPALPFVQIMVFQADYDKTDLQEVSCDVISVTSSLLRSQNNVTIFFPTWAHQSKFLVTPVLRTRYKKTTIFRMF